ncbi:MAG: protein kinase, partial [Myxococcota bacterium]|nr:protein kinase [Myxococcota bacterium]
MRVLHATSSEGAHPLDIQEELRLSRGPCPSAKSGNQAKCPINKNNGEAEDGSKRVGGLMQRVPRAVERSFELFERIGEGGMGAVYRARARQGERVVAVKLIDPKHLRQTHTRRAFLREAQAIARLRHRHVVELIDFGLDEMQGAFLVTEYISGGHLGDWRAVWPGWSRLLHATQSVLLGLAFAHARGIVHCDLKPENILLRDAQRGEAALADFGVSQPSVYRRNANAEPSSWQLGELTGTPTYMAPEQAEGRLGMYGPWTDFYALGVVLYEIVSARPPFDAASVPGLLLKHLREPPPALQLREGVAPLPAFEALLMRLLAKDPWERPRFAAALHQDFWALQEAARHADAESAVQLGENARHTMSTPIADPASPPLDGVALEHALTPRALPALSAVSERRRTLLSSGHLPWRRGEALAPNLRRLKLREPALVGRHQERALLHQTAESLLASRHSAVLMLEAEAGMGKTRLAEGLREWAEAYGTMESWWCSYRSDAPEHIAGLRGALATHYLCLGLDRAQAEQALSTRLSRLGAEDPWESRALLEWLFPAPTQERQPSLALSVGLALRAAVRASARTPLLVVMDDVHHGDGMEALSFAERLLQEHPQAPILVMLIFRPAAQRRQFGHVVDFSGFEERLQRLRASPQLQWLRLESMPTTELESLLMQEIGLESGAAQRIVRAGSGCPGRVLQLARAALDSQELDVLPSAKAAQPVAAPSQACSSGEGALLLEANENSVERQRPRLASPLSSGRYLEAYLQARLSRVRSPQGMQVLAMTALLGPSMSRRLLLDALQACWPEGRWSQHLDALLEAFDEDELLRWTIEDDRVLLEHEPLIRLSMAALLESGWASAAHAAAAGALRQGLGAQHGYAAARCARHLAQAGCVAEAWAMMATAVSDAALNARYAEAVDSCTELETWLDQWGDAADSESRGWLYRSMAWAAFRCGALEQGRSHLKRELARPTGEPAALAERALLQAEMALLEGDAAAAQRAFELARRGFEQVGHAREAAQAYLGLATAWRMLSDFMEARSAAQQAMRGFEGLGDARGSASAHRVLGQIALLEGDFSSSRQHYQQALALFEQAGDNHGIADVLRGLAGLEIESANIEAALQPLERAVSAYEAMGDFSGLAHALRGLARVRRARAQYDAAAMDLRRCIELFERLGVSLGAADALVDLASSLREQGELDGAVECLHRASGNYRQVGNERGVACCHLVLGNVYLDAAQHEQAIARQREALQLFERIDYRYGVRLAQLNLGHAYLQASWGDGRAASEASEACGGDAQAQL